MRRSSYLQVLGLIGLLCVSCASEFEFSRIAFVDETINSNRDLGAVCVRRIDGNETVFGQARIGPINRAVPALGIATAGEEVRDALRMRLSRAGLLSNDCESAPFRLDGHVHEFWVREALGYDDEYSRAVVVFEIVVKSIRDEVVWAAWAEGSFVSRTSWDTTDRNQETLQVALNRAVEDFMKFPGFIELVQM